MNPAGLHLPPIERRIFELVRQHPNLSPGELRLRVWNDPGKHTELHLAVSRLNRLLASVKLEVRTSGGGYQVRGVS